MIRSTVTEIYDMNTHINTLGIIGLHTPRFDVLLKHLFGHFVQFKRWKYEGATFSLVPAAQLPQDVAGVSLGAGDQSVDPRDIFNPILHKGFTGESLGAFLDKYLTQDEFRGDSLTYSFAGMPNPDVGNNPGAEVAYYQMLTQGDFKKMMPMSAIRNKRIYPLVYDVATTRQLSASWNGSYASDNIITEPIEQIKAAQFNQTGQGNSLLYPSMASDPVTDGFSDPVVMGRDYYGDGSDPDGAFGYDPVPFLTPRKRSLGWMDTLQKVFPAFNDTDGDVAQNDNSEPFTFSQLPKLFEYVLVTPPSYYTKMYYRMVIKHHVSFAGQRSAIGASNAISSVATNYYNFMDQLPSTTSEASVDTIGAEVTKVIDGMNAV